MSNFQTIFFSLRLRFIIRPLLTQNIVVIVQYQYIFAYKLYPFNNYIAKQKSKTDCQQYKNCKTQIVRLPSLPLSLINLYINIKFRFQNFFSWFTKQTLNSEKRKACDFFLFFLGCSANSKKQYLTESYNKYMRSNLKVFLSFFSRVKTITMSRNCF